MANSYAKLADPVLQEAGPFHAPRHGWQVTALLVFFAGLAFVAVTLIASPWTGVQGSGVSMAATGMASSARMATAPRRPSGLGLGARYRTGTPSWSAMASNKPVEYYEPEVVTDSQIKEFAAMRNSLPGQDTEANFDTLTQGMADASSVAGPMMSSQDIAESESQAWNLTVAGLEALDHGHYLPALGFSMAAAALIMNVHDADAATAAAAATSGVDFSAILSKAATKALGGGKAGATAAVVQVFSLMWLRTAMNYQYRYGGDLKSALKSLTDEGGIGRLYQGLPFALVQGPLSRFGDTATNVGVLALFDALPQAAGVPGPVRTAAASVAAGLWRIVCMPIDTSKTALQVEGKEGLERLSKKVLAEGPAPLFQGAIATTVATIAGNYPWFLTYNTLDGALPPVSKEEILQYLLRSALLGVSASCVSDTVSNSLRVIKTTQQTAALSAEGKSGGISVAEALNIVLEKDGLKGLFGRGLQTRLLTNAIQGGLFSVLWRYFQQSGR